MAEIHGIQILECPTDGPTFSRPQEVVALIGEAISENAGLVAIPASRLDSAFFQLRTGFAGEVLQKFTNHRLRLAILGDISEFVRASNALRDLVRESNRGDMVWFLISRDELDERLSGNC
jgi:hypothetical protein